MVVIKGSSCSEEALKGTVERKSQHFLPFAFFLMSILTENTKTNFSSLFQSYNDSPLSLVLTAQTPLVSFTPGAEVCSAAAFAIAVVLESALIVASRGASASLGNGASRLVERPCRKVWVSFSCRKRFDILLHQDCTVQHQKVAKIWAVRLKLNLAKQ